MNRRITLVLAFAGMMLVAANLAAAGGNKAMSPVGAWSIQYVDDVSADDNNTILAQYHFGGTISGAAWTDPWTNTVGSWKKAGRNRYLATFYVMIPDGDGYLKVIEEFWMVDKDEMEGRQEAWWVPGMDPLGPPVAPLWTGSQFYKRIPAEPKQLP